MSADQCYYAEPNLWDRLRWKLFPRASRPEVAGDARTYITTDVRVDVDWFDRLRLLVSGRILVQLRTYTDVEVKQAQSVSVFSVEP